MDTLRDFEDFACPAGVFPSELAELVAREQAAEVVRRFFHCYHPQLEERCRGIIDLLDRWFASGGGGFASWWNEAFSQAAEVLRNGDGASIIHRGVALAVHASESGVPGAWEADLEMPRRYRWDRWLLPLSQSIAVRSDGVEASVTLKTKSRDAEIRFFRSESGWNIETNELVEAMTEVGTSRPPILLLPQAAAGEPLAASVPPFEDTVSPAVASAWRDALAFLRQYAAVYAPWVERVVRHIGLVAVTPGVVHSGSYRHRHGFIHASARSSIVSMVEVLVHEASHQYFYLLCCLGPVDDGTDRTTYYSPLVGKERPLDRILFAFHACANILRFYRLCVANDAPDVRYCVRNEPIVVRQMEQLNVALRDSRALTPVGRTLYLPLVGTRD